MSDQLKKEPLNEVIWRNREKLKPNNYNPNRTLKKELKLLVTSILADGWTQPIVINQDLEIVDGFHRWTVSGENALMERYGGMVPTVMIDPAPGDQMMSTIRHNRARGHHQLLEMQKITNTLLEAGYTKEQLDELLGMEDEEVTRLTNDKSIAEEISETVTEFSKGWEPIKSKARD